MTSKEYYIILPLLLYGLGIADLVNSWRSFFVSKRRYWPYIITSLILLEAAFWNFFRMNEWMAEGSYVTYLSYSRFIITPLVFILVVAVFTPEQETEDIEKYFTTNMRVIFGGLAVFVALHFLFIPPDGMALKELTGRLVGIALLVFMAVVRKPSLVYVLLVFRIITYFIEGR